MNGSRKFVVGLGALVLVAMLACPPWLHTVDSRSVNRTRPAGYAMLFAPPEPESNAPAYGVEVDAMRLAMQIGGVVLLVGAAWAVMGKGKQ